jgi:hypothetical protein
MEHAAGFNHGYGRAISARNSLRRWNRSPAALTDDRWIAAFAALKIPNQIGEFPRLPKHRVDRDSTIGALAFERLDVRVVFHNRSRTRFMKLSHRCLQSIGPSILPAADEALREGAMGKIFPIGKVDMSRADRGTRLSDRVPRASFHDRQVLGPRARFRGAGFARG